MIIKTPKHYKATTVKKAPKEEVKKDIVKIPEEKQEIVEEDIYNKYLLEDEEE